MRRGKQKPGSIVDLSLILSFKLKCINLNLNLKNMKYWPTSLGKHNRQNLVFSATFIYGSISYAFSDTGTAFRALEQITINHPEKRPFYASHRPNSDTLNYAICKNQVSIQCAMSKTIQRRCS